MIDDELQTLVRNSVRAARAEKLKRSDQLTLGELIAKLERLRDQDAGRVVKYDFAYFHPKRLASWRGAYDELALNYENTSEPLSVGELIELLQSAIGKTFEGYKGGEYVMGKTTPLWVSDYGEGCNTAIVGVLDDGYQIILQTGWREY